MTKPEQINQTLHQMLSSKLGAIDPTTIVGLDEKMNEMFVGGKKLTETQMRNFASEAKTFKSMEIYKLIMGTIPAQAQHIIFGGIDFTNPQKENTKGIFGGAALYTIDLIQKIVNACELYPQIVEKRKIEIEKLKTEKIPVTPAGMKVPGSSGTDKV